MTESQYDADLGRVTDQDRQYAKEILDEIANHTSSLNDVAEWLRKVRYEAVMADRKLRDSHGEQGDEK